MSDKVIPITVGRRCTHKSWQLVREGAQCKLCGVYRPKVPIIVQFPRVATPRSAA